MARTTPVARVPRVGVMRSLALSATACALVLTLTACVPGGTVADTTTGDYYAAIDESDRRMNEVASWVASDAIEREEDLVNDLDEDNHRNSCSDTTSYYSNLRNMWLTAAADPVAIVDELRERLAADGYGRIDSVDEKQGLAQDPTAGYFQKMMAPDGYLVTVSKWPDDAGVAGVSVAVDSPCVPNPTDKSDRWGR